MIEASTPRACAKFKKASTFTGSTEKVIRSWLSLTIISKGDKPGYLTKAFSKSCSNQICWLRTDIVKNLKNEDITNNTFRPPGPSTGYDWLSTTNINDVINQYENTYDDFVFLGALPNDFQELPNSEIFYQKFPEIRNKTLILFLGRIDPKKGLDLLAIAFKKIHIQFPDTHLILAGPDNINFSPTVKDYFSEVNCLDAVTFTGMLTGTLKYATLAAADIYVAPSYSEGFSVSVLEGMASGLPCVITTGCNFPEAIGEKAALVVDIDATQIDDAILWCLANPEESRQMGDRARKLIFEKYTWDNISKIMIETYTNILTKN
jgi:glycosyltransferase involved in cell wall biosynthesis